MAHVSQRFSYKVRHSQCSQVRCENIGWFALPNSLLSGVQGAAPWALIFPSFKIVHVRPLVSPSDRSETSPPRQYCADAMTHEMSSLDVAVSWVFILSCRCSDSIIKSTLDVN